MYELAQVGKAVGGVSVNRHENNRGGIWCGSLMIFKTGKARGSGGSIILSSKGYLGSLLSFFVFVYQPFS